MIKKKHWSKSLTRDFILEQLEIGLWYWDIVNNNLQWDKAMYSLYGVEMRAENEAYETWQNALHPDWKERAEEDLRLALDGTKEFDTVFGIITKNGIRYIAGRGQVIRDSNGTPIKMYGLNWDITEEYIAREELKKNQEILEHKSKLILIGELAAGIGHELNNPITYLRAYLNQISDLTECRKMKEKVEFCLEASSRITAITNGLRAFVRKEHSKNEFFDLISLLRNTISLVYEIYKLEGISIETDFPEGEVFLNGNEGQIQQVLMNLLSNSRYALIKDKDSFFEKEKTISLFVTCSKYNVTIIYSDNGPGIEKDIQSKIFNPFFTTKPIGEGTGIGLSMNSKIVADHLGTINYVNNGPNKGATFELNFPSTLQNPQIHRGELTQNDEFNSGELIGKHALIVEDEDNIRDILNSILDELGVIVESATNGLDALKLCQHKKFDIVLTDIRMPQMNGDEFVKLASEKGYLNKSKIICMTAGIAQTEELVLKNINVDHFLEKPFDDADVINLLYKKSDPHCDS